MPVQMIDSKALDPFSCLRLPYHGVKDTVKCVEVDLEMNRLYVACNAGGVFVWNLATHQPYALMKHDQWVNSVRCYPPKFDPAQIMNSPLAVDQMVLTACENGVLSAWNPVTFLVKARVRPGCGPLTEIMLARTDRHTKKFITTSEYLCYVASLRHVYVIQVSPEFVVLHDLVHAGNVLCLTAHHSVRTQSVLCGQDNGSVSLWSLASGKYECTVEYPTDSKDIIEDQKLASVHKPLLGDNGVVSHTFRYNRERSEAAKAQRKLSIYDTEEEIAKYSHKMPAALDSFFVHHSEENKALMASSGHRWSGLKFDTPGQPQELVDEDKAPIDTLTYDLRRVTCIIATPKDSQKSHRFYTGHGTGEVLVWESTYRRQPILLLKKIQVFPFGSWVWHMQPMEIPRNEHPDEVFIVDPDRPVFLQLAVWGDSGAVRYMQISGTVTVTDGPGFLATSSAFWRGPRLDLRTAQEAFRIKKVDLAAWSGTSQRTAPTEEGSAEESEGQVVKELPFTEEDEPGIGYYMIMGSFEGRLEIFDITTVVVNLRNSSWK